MSRHGGDIYGFAIATDSRPEDIIDFSASINPIGAPSEVMKAIKEHLRDIEHYPDPEATLLKRKLSEAFRIDPSIILCGNGCTELIYMLPGALRFNKVMIPQPTFIEYEHACRAMRPGCIVAPYPLSEADNFDIDPVDLVGEAIKTGVDALFLCNPNNPTGRLAERDRLEAAAAMAKRRGIFLVVDESFIDFTQEPSLVGLVEKNHSLIVLRSMTKFYALPGLRLGWGVFPPDVLSAMIKIKEPWSVNTLSQAAGVAALGINNFHGKTIEYIGKQKKLLEKGFLMSGVQYIPSSANYYLLRTPEASHIANKLKEQKILVRNCFGFAGLDERYIRIAVRKRKENAVLLNCLKGFL